MSGFAGLFPLKNRKPESNMLKGCALSLKKESADLAVGPVVFIVEIAPSPVQDKVKLE